MYKDELLRLHKYHEFDIIINVFKLHANCIFVFLIATSYKPISRSCWLPKLTPTRSTPELPVTAQSFLSLGGRFEMSKCGLSQFFFQVPSGKQTWTIGFFYSWPKQWWFFISICVYGMVRTGLLSKLQSSAPATPLTAGQRKFATSGAVFRLCGCVSGEQRPVSIKKHRRAAQGRKTPPKTGSETWVDNVWLVLGLELWRFHGLKSLNNESHSWQHESQLCTQDSKRLGNCPAQL